MWLIIQFNSWKNNGILGKLKGWCEPIFILFPINVLGDCTLPISLSLRLFGNLLAGTIIMSLIYSLFSIVGAAVWVFTPFLHAYFDIFSGFIQTYIFFTLSTFFLSQELTEE